MKKNLIIYTALLSILFIAGCRKDKDEAPAFDIAGVWKVSSSSTFSTNYYHFGANNFVYVLTIDNKSLRSVNKGVYDFSGDQLLLSFPPDDQSVGNSISNTLYNIRQGTDTVLLDNANYNNEEVVLIKDNLAPKTIADFITPVQPAVSFADTAGARYLACKNGELYGSNGHQYILIYSTAQQKISEVRPMVNYYGGIDFDYAGNLWATQYDSRVYKISPVDGSVMITSAMGDGYLKGLTYDGIYWVAASGYGDKLLQYYAPTDVFEGSFGSNSDCDDLAFAKGYGYVVNDGAINRYKNSFSSYDKSYYVEGYKCIAIAYDSNNDKFWVSALNFTTGKYEILQLQLN